ncbi:MAG: IS200/IS605 family transposase, partial [Methanotrichaceae archaeon]|nr:IS200/IS605 family transposase [Methanotrichaceae archaeon]
MAKDRWTHSNTTIYNIGYHLIWCPKYGRKVLVGDVEARLKQLLTEKANEIGVSIEEMKILPDHV